MGPTDTAPRRRRLTRPQQTILAVSIVAIVAVGTGLAVRANLGGRPSSSAAAASREPSSPAAPGVEPVPSGMEGGQWAAVDVGPRPVVATFEPASADVAGVAADSAFTLASQTGESAEAIAARLVVSPAADFVVSGSADGRTAKLTPAVALTQGETYRVALRTVEGTLEGSWAFHVRGPVQVSSTIPGDATTEVPIRAGIEVAFDQDDIADMASHFAISPAVDGRFERHGRTQVFVPSALAPATLYTVTIRRGLARTGTDLVLDRDVIFRFETEGSGAGAQARLRFGRDVVEVSPNENPVLAVTAIGPEREDGTPAPAPTSADVIVYRVPSIDVASSMLATFLAAPRWSEYTDPLMPTGGLPVTLRASVDLVALTDDTLVIRLPDSLAAGWYIVELPGPRPTQAMVQVTPISAWVTVLSDRTVVWTNDVTNGSPMRGATVRVEGGPVIGQSDAEGLITAATPSAIVPPAAVDPDAVPSASSPILRVTSPAGHSVLVPFGVAGSGEAYRGEWSEKSLQADSTYWAVLYTDRGVYRRDDTVQVWGYMRGRDDGTVPPTIDVRLVTTGGGRSPGEPGIVRAPARISASGSFTASLPLAGLPIESYEVQAVVDGRLIVSRWIDVTVIRKPPYRVSLVPDHTAVISGTAVRWTATATFFDGSPAPGLDMRFEGAGIDPARVRTTNATGTAAVSARPQAGSASEDYDANYISVAPKTPEAAEILAGATVVVFPAAYDLEAEGVVSNGRLKVAGSLHAINLAKVEREIAAGTWSGGTVGRPIGGKRVTVNVSEIVPIRRIVGNTYDFVDKVVRPRYEYDTERRLIATRTVATGADGRFRFSLEVPSTKHEYEVALETVDGAGRTERETVYAGKPFESQSDPGVTFQETDGKPAGEKSYAIGDRIVWQMTAGGRRFPSDGPDRYLYIVAQRGLRSVDVTDSATLRHTFTRKDAPGIFIIGVRFTGSTYAPKAASWANFDPRTRGIRVKVTADRGRYGPGETANLSIRTTDPAGRPVAATVVLQAVDEKLYAMGGASVPRPLDDLYRRVDSGILRLTATHQTPSNMGPEGEGGDTTGGGERSDFEDTLVFRTLTTNANGRATATVALSDDLTSWHVTAGAVTSDLRAGAGELLIPVGLPFFVEATIADTYLLADHPVIALRAYGSGLRRGDPIEFTIAAPGLGLPPKHVTGKAFQAVEIGLPSLALGRGSITVGARAPTRKGSDGKPLSDRLVRTFDVIESRLTSARIAYGVVGGELPSLAGSTGLTTYTFTDAGRGALMPLLLSAAERGGMRLDRLAAQATARRLLIQEFGWAPAALPTLDIDESQYQIGTEMESEEDNGAGPGIGLLPWSGPDPWLTARIAIAAPTAVQADLRSVLLAIRSRDATKRDLAIATLAGLASVGEPVLVDLESVSHAPDLTVTERLHLALGFAAAGDEASASEIERDLLSKAGQRLGPWVRLRVGDDLDATADATALLAIVAGSVGDPLGADMAGYVIANPGRGSVHELELVAYAGRALERVPAGGASFAYTVDGHRTAVELDPGESRRIVLTDGQRATLAVEAIGGTVGVAVEGRVVVAPATFTTSPDLILTRKVPAAPLPTDRIVVVNLTATFAPGAPEGCYTVVELVPSGLAPMAGAPFDDETTVTWPMSATGQEVRFCANNDPKGGHTAHLRYRARVVNAGAFSWEPAVMQLPAAPDLIAVAPGRTIRIGAR
jgi:hypothetical protein